MRSTKVMLMMCDDKRTYEILATREYVTRNWYKAARSCVTIETLKTLLHELYSVGSYLVSMENVAKPLEKEKWGDRECGERAE